MQKIVITGATSMIGAALAKCAIKEGIKVLLCASEAGPFIKSGGLADVAAALPKALKRAGNDVRIILPLYHDIDYSFRSKFKYAGSLYVPLSWRKQYCGVFEAEHDGVTYYFIDNE